MVLPHYLDIYEIHANVDPGTVDYTPQSTDKNQIGLANYLGEANNRSDIQIFLQKFRPEAVGAAYNFTVQIIADGNDQQTPNNSTQLAAGKDLEGKQSQNETISPESTGN